MPRVVLRGVGDSGMLSRMLVRMMVGPNRGGLSAADMVGTAGIMILRLPEQERSVAGRIHAATGGADASSAVESVGQRPHHKPDAE